MGSEQFSHSFFSLSTPHFFPFFLSSEKLRFLSPSSPPSVVSILTPSSYLLDALGSEERERKEEKSPRLSLLLAFAASFSSLSEEERNHGC